MLKKIIPSLFMELYVSILATLLLIAALFVGIMTYIDNSTATRDFYRDARQAATPLLHAIQRTGDIPASLLKHVEQNSNFNIRKVNNAEVNKISQQANYLKAINNIKIFEDKTLPHFIALIPLTHQEQWLIIQDHSDEPGNDSRHLQDEVPEIELEPSEQNLISSLKITFVCLLLLFAAVLMILVKRINKHVDTLLEANTQWRQGKFSTRIGTKMPAPFDKLSLGFNAMASDIEKMFNEQNILMSAISHELRTPISKIQLSLSLLELQHHLSHDPQVQETHRYIDELTYLVDQTLTLAKLNHLDAFKNQENIDITKLMKTTINALAPLHPGKNCSFSTAQTVIYQSDGLYLQILIGNLLDNAFKYAKKNLKATLNTSNGGLFLSIEDDGEGVQEGDKKDMLAAFSRLDSSRNKSTGGYGLGLAIVDAIVKHHQGRIDLSNSDLGGLNVSITLPKLAQGV